MASDLCCPICSILKYGLVKEYAIQLSFQIALLDSDASKTLLKCTPTQVIKKV